MTALGHSRRGRARSKSGDVPSSAGSGNKFRAFAGPRPWRDLPETYGPRTTCYNRFVRWLPVMMRQCRRLVPPSCACTRYLGQQSPSHWSLARTHHEQASRGGGHQWSSGPSRARANESTPQNEARRAQELGRGHAVAGKFLTSAIFSLWVGATFSTLCEVFRSVAYSGRRTSF